MPPPGTIAPWHRRYSTNSRVSNTYSCILDDLQEVRSGAVQSAAHRSAAQSRAEQSSIIHTAPEKVPVHPLLPAWLETDRQRLGDDPCPFIRLMCLDQLGMWRAFERPLEGLERRLSGYRNLLRPRHSTQRADSSEPYAPSRRGSGRGPLSRTDLEEAGESPARVTCSAPL